MKKLCKYIRSFIESVVGKHLILPILTLIVSSIMFVIFTEYRNMIFGAFIGFLVGKSIFDITMIIHHTQEDRRKAIRDYDQLKTFYHESEYGKKFITFPQKKAFSKTLKKGNVKLFYDELLTNNHRYSVDFKDNPKQFYKIPELIYPYYAELLSAHKASYTENAVTYRLIDKPKIKDSKVEISIARTTYYDHLAMNRAIDFPIKGSFTVRKKYEYGKLLNPLKNKVLPNQIGVNAIILFNDKRTIFPRRSLISTVAKNKITSSLAIRLDTENKNTSLNEAMVFKDFKEKMQKRLGFTKDEVDSPMKMNLIGVGRDLFEGGKPQFYYLIEFSELSSDDYIKRLKITQKNRKKDRKGQIDYDRLIYVSDFDELQLKKEYTLSFNSYYATKNGKVKKRRFRKSAKPEISFFFNLWHYLKIEKHPNLSIK